MGMHVSCKSVLFADGSLMKLRSSWVLMADCMHDRCMQSVGSVGLKCTTELPGTCTLTSNILCVGARGIGGRVGCSVDGRMCTSFPTPHPPNNHNSCIGYYTRWIFTYIETSHHLVVLYLPVFTQYFCIFTHFYLWLISTYKDMSHK